MQHLELCVDQLVVGKAQQILELVHEVVFILVHLAVHIDDLPKGFDDLDFFRVGIVLVDQVGKLP